ncbi:MAG: FlaD/FlaE family flagellar protein [Halodesulfurarchaeum sp.]
MVPFHLSPSLLGFLPLGVIGLGMASWLDGEDEGESGGEEDFGMDDFEEDDFGGMGDIDDDLGGMDDMGGGDVSTTELESRIEDLEAEIADVSSTANTVRSENEQISEKVDEVEENVRKLLEIYEMVTRGVNPFVDEVSGGMGMGTQEGGFGLFDETGEDSGSSEDELDDDLANAEAEDFFDDDAFDEIDDEPMVESDFEMDEGESEQRSVAAESEDSDTDSGGGTSFEELKQEYESGEADWADEDIEGEGRGIEEQEDVGFDEAEEGAELGTESGTTTADDSTLSDPGDLFQVDDLAAEHAEDETVGESGATDESAMQESVSVRDAIAETEESTDAVSEPDEETPPSSGEEASLESGKARSQETTDRESVSESGPDTAGAGEDETETIGGFQFGTTTTGGRETPYLASPPNGYLADVVVLEWLSFLLDEFDSRNAVRAINYYKRIGWIGEDVRDHLITALMGVTDSEYLYRDEFGTTELSMSDHKRSLEYIEELSAGNLDRRVADRLDLMDA